MHDRMRPELLVAGEVVALDQEVDVEVPEHRREAVDVVELLFVPAPPHPQPIAERLLPVGHGGDEKPRRVQALGRATTLPPALSTTATASASGRKART